ncbi:MAG: hypothetical protein EAZ84_13215 [Verrucomicrobia bacterium]|nr:MAG: hypothetical protein EAZ84_13215 [Verrucomicrobiota bacterium]
MKRKRHSSEQIVKKRWTVGEEQARGTSIEKVCRKLEISVATYLRLNKDYSGAKMEIVKRPKELEKENARLKKLVAVQAHHLSGSGQVIIASRNRIGFAGWIASLIGSQSRG